MFHLISSSTSSVHFESGSGFYSFASVSGFYQTSPDFIHILTSEMGLDFIKAVRKASPGPDFISL